ncbi:hypothetical protein GCM10025858_20310 [Alicyclobacillus sacchari]|nr:hypothetical protein GCM10025858_20310 [Alicyclobacillus sacchari]
MNRCAIDDLRDEVQLRRRVAAPAASLRAGGLVAFPTETVYGLGANALDDTAVRRIFAAKRRPVDNPLIVHIASESQLDACLPVGYQLDADARKLMQAFWPGPLTLLLLKQAQRLRHRYGQGNNSSACACQTILSHAR